MRQNLQFTYLVLIVKSIKSCLVQRNRKSIYHGFQFVYGNYANALQIKLFLQITPAMSKHFTEGFLTPKSPQYRPLSGTYIRTRRADPYSSRSIDVQNLKQQKTPAENRQSPLKMKQQQLRSTKAEDLGFAQDTIKLNLNNKKKIRVDKYRKQTTNGRPIPSEDQYIFVDRKTIDYRRPQLRPKKMTTKLKIRVPTNFRQEIGAGLREKYNSITPAARPFTGFTKQREEKKRYQEQQLIPQLQNKSRPSRSSSIAKRAITNPQLQLQQDFQQKSPFGTIDHNDQKMNKIMDIIGDKNLNNILWNDPAIKKILEEIGIQDEKELNNYLENNFQYFQNLFKSSPFGNLSMHYVRPKQTIYTKDYTEKQRGITMKQAMTLNNMPIVMEEDYECLAKMHRQKKIIKDKKTIQQSEFVPKETKLDRIVPPESFTVGQPQIANLTTYSMNFPSRGDYDPTRIFKRIEERNVVTGAHWMYKTSYQQSFGKTERSNSEDLFSIDYIKERQQSKPFHTKLHTHMKTQYNQSFHSKQASYNKSLPFKYATQLEKPQNKSLPISAYNTTKKIDSQDIVEKSSQMLSLKRKKPEPWKFRILSKIKALIEYKNFLNRKKK